ncbi:MAG: hypothetical protein VXZ72_00290, partial [Chlamydiota bacterium]|nr:hypothetical protein [Chlamydiota bacterium]
NGKPSEEWGKIYYTPEGEEKGIEISLYVRDHKPYWKIQSSLPSCFVAPSGEMPFNPGSQLQLHIISEN